MVICDLVNCYENRLHASYHDNLLQRFHGCSFTSPCKTVRLSFVTVFAVVYARLSYICSCVYISIVGTYCLIICGKCNAVLKNKQKCVLLLQCGDEMMMRIRARNWKLLQVK